MNLRAIIASVPLLRRLWRVLPPALRAPLLVVAAVVGLWYVVTGRHRQRAGELPK